MWSSQNDIPKRKRYIIVHLHITICTRWEIQCLHDLFTESAPLGGFSHRVAMSVCLYVCLSVCLSVCLWQFTSSGRCGDLWSKGVSLISACNDRILVFFSPFWWFFCVFKFFGVFWIFWDPPKYLEAPIFFNRPPIKKYKKLWIFLIPYKKIPHTRDTKSLDRCG